MAEKKATPRRTTRAKAAPPKAAATRPAAPGALDACPKCGSTAFAPEERIRADGRRTVRYTVLVCERGHTFAKPVRRPV